LREPEAGGHDSWQSDWRFSTAPAALLLPGVSLMRGSARALLAGRLDGKKITVFMEPTTQGS